MAWRRLCFYTQYYVFKNAKNAFDVGSLQLPTMQKKTPMIVLYLKRGFMAQTAENSQ